MLFLSGSLKEGDPLPSMRMLAKELRISIITTKRAYEELERDGYIAAYSGKGCFVRRVNVQMARENVLFEIEDLMEKVLDKASFVDVSYEELSEMLQTLYEQRKREI